MSKAGVHLVIWGMGLLLLLGATVNAEISADPLKTAEAMRAASKITVDGILNESDWESAPAITGFRQSEPDEGRAASESTMVKILYDDEAIYVGFRCYDSEPDKIIKQLTRRDEYTEADKVTVKIDSYHDHQTSYYFDVNAAGVMRDVLIYDNNSSDDSWDAVWDAHVKVTRWGWAAELKIPYSALRFSKADEYTWGIDFERYIPRKKEYDYWQFVPEHTSHGVSRFGHLVGVEGVAPPARTETLPYLVSSGTSKPKSIINADGQEFMSNMGVNFKYGISSSMTFDAAVNPDFGQVESDPAVINLTAFETFYEEKRPFFLEGSEIFRTPFVQLFYSRRIGRAPTGSIKGADYVDGPRNTTILSALKLTGKTKTGTSLGILNITTQEEKRKYRIEGDPKTYEAVVEPLANYSVVRVKQDIGGSSYLGGIVTSANQKERSDAFTVAGDWKLYFLDQMFNFDGMLVETNNGPGTGDMAASFSLSKSGGRIIRGNIKARYIGRNADWNRMGFMQRNSNAGSEAWIQLYSNKNLSIFRYMNVNFNGWYTKNLDGYRLLNGGNINGYISFTNNWSIEAGYGVDGSKYDDRETRGNGLWFIQSNTRKWVGFGTNPARKIQLHVNYHQDNEKDGLFHLYRIETGFRPMTNLEFSLGASYISNRNVDFWVGSGEDNLPVFGKLDNNDMDVSLRGTYTFTRNLSLQWYTQMYFSAGDYDRFRKLTSPEGLEEVDPEEYEISFAKNDYNYKSLNLNLVLRWEYLPGSALYVVWTHARQGYVTDYGDFSFSRDFNDLFETPQTNTFLVKANYWWNI